MAGYLARRHALTLITLGITCCFCLGGLNFARGALGLPGDLGGLAQLPWVIGLSLFTVAPVVIVAGAFGAKLRDAHA